MAIQIQLRRDTAANWTSVNPKLAQGEIGIETDTFKLKIGDGVTDWNTLPYYATGVTKVTATITIAVADWSGGTTCTKTVSGLLTTDFITPVMDRTNLALYVAADITGELQAGQIVFTCTTTPTSQIVVPLNIVR